MKLISLRFLVLVAIIFSAALLRILPHPYNFTPIAAMALFGGSMFGRKIWSFIVPLSAMLLSDFVIGFHGSMYSVYSSFVLIAILGIVFLQKANFRNVVVLSLISSLLFFTITNFFVWYGSSFYPQNTQGLISCYAAGLSFYQNSFFGNLFANTVMGDLFFNGILFGSFYILQSYIPKLRFA